MERCAYPGCPHDADPRWFVSLPACDAHGETRDEESVRLFAEIDRLKAENAGLRSQIERKAMDSAGDRRDWDECDRIDAAHSKVRPFTFGDALRIARGCTDYKGGFDGADYERFQDGIATVIRALEMADQRDPQTAALLSIGDEARSKASDCDGLACQMPGAVRDCEECTDASAGQCKACDGFGYYETLPDGSRVLVVVPCRACHGTGRAEAK